MREELLSPLPAPSSASADDALRRYSGAAMNRYKDAYVHARTINGIGQAIKITSAIVGGLIALSGMISCANAGTGSFEAVAGGVSFVLGVVVGLLGFSVGVLIQSQGQQLKASLDCAVHGSPFLDDEQRAAMMSLT